MARLARQFLRSESGSISAPARKVSTTDPNAATKVVKSVCCTRLDRPGTLPAIAPTRISTRATATPARMLIRVATSARAIQTATTVYGFMLVLLLPPTNSLVEAIIPAYDGRFKERASSRRQGSDVSESWFSGAGACRWGGGTRCGPV